MSSSGGGGGGSDSSFTDAAANGVNNITEDENGAVEDGC